MFPVEVIKKKRDGHSLDKQEISFLVKEYTENRLPDYQMAAFLMAVCTKGMTHEETSLLTLAMLETGDKISHPKDNNKPLVGKHSTGGVGDKISIPLVPLLASVGLRVPKLSGRGLGHTGGTLDKLESIKGFKTSLSSDEYTSLVQEIGCCIMGQTKNIVPADKKIYALRDVTGTVESIPLISSSIMSKKLAEGVGYLVLDVKFGSGAFMKSLINAEKLAESMVKIGEMMGVKVSVCLTNMDQPLGRMIGNSLEIIETVEILKNQGPEDTTFLVTEIGAEMLYLSGKTNSLEAGRQLLQNSLSTSKALEVFRKMITLQGGNADFIDNPGLLGTAKQKIDILSPLKGFIKTLQCEKIGHAAVLLGGGRKEIGDKIDPNVGIEVHKKIGDLVQKDEPIFTIHANAKGIQEAQNTLLKAFEISLDEVVKPNLYEKRLSTK